MNTFIANFDVYAHERPFASFYSKTVRLTVAGRISHVETEDI